MLSAGRANQDLARHGYQPFATDSEHGVPELHDALAIEPQIAAAISTYGRPTAIQQLVGKWQAPGESAARLTWGFALYWKAPIRSLVYLWRAPWPYKYYPTIEWDFVPRSVERIVMDQPAQPSPWPVTVPETERDLFASWAEDSPDVPWEDLSPSHTNAFRFKAGADKARAELKPASTADQLRAAAAFAKLAKIAVTPGIDWRLTVYQATDPPKTLPLTYWGADDFSYIVMAGYSLDGTVFVSDRLVEKLDDKEVIALLAHEMGHITSSSIGIFFNGDYPYELLKQFPDQLNPRPLPLEGELRADAVATAYLAKLGIPPDTLFDTLVLITDRPYPQLAGDYLGGYTSMAAFGVLLDTGKLAKISRNQLPAGREVR